MRIVLSLLIPVCAIAFQNCGGFQASSSTKESLQAPSLKLMGNAVREAKLDGVDIDSTVGIAATGSSSELVSCAADKSSCRVPNMPLLSQLDMPSPLAPVLCVPTATSMLMEALLASGMDLTGPVGQEYKALGDATQRTLWLAKKMNTNDLGTYNFQQEVGVDDLVMHSSPKFRQSTVFVSDISPELMKKTLDGGGIGSINYGHYKVMPTILLSGRQTSLVLREGGHSVALSGYSVENGQLKIAYNDPWDRTRYSRVLERDPVERADGSKVMFPFTSADGKYSGYYMFKFPVVGSGEEYLEIVDYFRPLSRVPASQPNQPEQPNQPTDPTTPIADQRQAWIGQLYSSLLARSPDAAGVSHFTSIAMSSASVEQCRAVFRGFLDSAEFIDRQSRMSDGLFIETLYMGVLRRNPYSTGDSASVEAWMAHLGQGNSRESVKAQFLQAEETTSLCRSLGYQ